MKSAAQAEKPLAPLEPRRYTYDELVAVMPESTQPSELREGRLIMSPAPSFQHQRIVMRLARLLDQWVVQHDLGEIVTSPIDMVLAPGQAVQPDIVFIAKQRLGIIQRVIIGPGDWVAEVISPGGKTRDRIEKRDLYEQYGIKEYWIIDPDSGTIDVLFLAAGRYDLVMRVGPGETAKSRLLPAFSVAVDGIMPPAKEKVTPKP